VYVLPCALRQARDSSRAYEELPRKPEGKVVANEDVIGEPGSGNGLTPRNGVNSTN
jgi:hypothetical protein